MVASSAWISRAAARATGAPGGDRSARGSTAPGRGAVGIQAGTVDAAVSRLAALGAWTPVMARVEVGRCAEEAPAINVVARGVVDCKNTPDGVGEALAKRVVERSVLDGEKALDGVGLLEASVSVGEEVDRGS